MTITAAIRGDGSLFGPGLVVIKVRAKVMKLFYNLWDSETADLPSHVQSED